MRFLSRLHWCAGAVILLVLYSFWHLNYPDKSIATVWRRKALRIVVFGDDWSDTGHHRYSPPRDSSVVGARDPDRGEIWVETLCEELLCDIHNFARAVPPNADPTSVGSVVDAEVWQNATSGTDSAAVSTFDFKAQVQQFLDFKEKGTHYFSGSLRRIDEQTLFTVYYGLWDLLQYSRLPKAQAMQAIDDTIAALFQALDLLSDSSTVPIRVVLPRMIDVTFLPCFQSRFNSTQKDFAMTQHHMVFLWSYWNNVLVRTAMEWEGGDIFIPDSNSVIMEQVRAKQLSAAPFSNTSKQTQAPLFDFIQQPCLVSKSDSDPTQPSGMTEKCVNPDLHLFWDEVHLSGMAHSLIGLHAAGLVLSNASVNAFPPSQGFSQFSTRPGIGFNLRFPPGY